MADGALLVQMLTAGGGSVVVGAIVNGILNRRKLGADATQAITEAASGMLGRLQEENLRQRGELTDLRNEIRELRVEIEEGREEIRAYRDVLDVHAAWDFRALQAVERLTNGRSDLRPVPPLTPPRLRSVNE